jgi:carboxymethylenebutenolidase
MCTPPDACDGPHPAPAATEEQRMLRMADGAALRALVAQPASGSRNGVVLIIHDIWGYTDFYKDLARRITQHGHEAVLVDFFGRQGDLPESMRAPERGSPPDAFDRARERAQQLSDEQFLSDFQVAVDHLHASDAERVACWGFCMGGRLAYVAAARARGLAGVVAYYGHLQAEGARLSPLQLAADIKIPVLGIFGGADSGIPQDQVKAFERVLKTDKEIVTYDGAPHGFLRYGVADHKAAIDDALRRTFGFFDRVISSSAPVSR